MLTHVLTPSEIFHADIFPSAHIGSNLYSSPTLSGLDIVNKTIGSPRQIQMSLKFSFCFSARLRALSSLRYPYPCHRFSTSAEYWRPQ